MTRDDLEALLKNPAWQELARTTRARWTEHLYQQVEPAANDRDDLMALQKIRQAMAAKREAEAILEWPTRQLQKYHSDSPPSTLARGGWPGVRS